MTLEETCFHVRWYLRLPLRISSAVQSHTSKKNVHPTENPCDTGLPLFQDRIPVLNPSPLVIGSAPRHYSSATTPSVKPVPYQLDGNRTVPACSCRRPGRRGRSHTSGQASP